MPAITQVSHLFAQDIHRRIEEVIKVDQTDETVLADEIAEYVVTSSIRRQQTEILEAYLEASRKPHEGTAVWVSGFFGSGKSSFAKMLGIGIADRVVAGRGAAGLLGERTGDTKAQVLLRQVSEKVPTEAVIFDVSTDRGIKSANQSITEIMYRLFLQHLGYPRELDLAELEITLEGEGRLDAFKVKYQELHAKDWDRDKGLPALAIGRASAVLHAIEPQVYNAPDSWVRGIKGRADITPSLLADRCLELLARRSPKRNLLFVVDEVGQFVARDPQKLEDLRAVVEKLGQKGRGRIWVMVTSQEQLSELISGLDQTRVELPKVKDRFPLQVHLEPSDITEVTSRRVLAKNADAQKALRSLFETWGARLGKNTEIDAPGIRKEAWGLTAGRFMDLYPLLPYQVDLIISVVSGLRTQGGAAKHVGGANRTIIKLAQQLLVHQDVNLAGQPIGVLASLDRIYDLVAGNIASDVRAKIDAIGREVDHTLAAPVAKAICLLQYAQNIPRTDRNIAATLHPRVDADSRLTEVKAALDALVAAHAVRLGEDGYRIPTPAEDDWERQRTGISPKPADSARIHAEVITGLWSPQPSHNLQGVKPFKAGLFYNNKLVVEGDIPVYVTLAEGDEEYKRLIGEWRSRSQTEKTALFWVARLDDAITRATDEVFRSTEILARKERTATSRDETNLVNEEKRRQRRHQDEVRRLVREALLRGTMFFRGNDRSPEASAADVGKACAHALAQALPQVFDRFPEAAARVVAKDLDALLTTENLRGLPPVFMQLQLVREEKGKPVFRTDAGPLSEVLARIANKASYGDPMSGRAITDELAREPFGWDFDVVRLFVACLLRAGKIEAISKGQVIDNALSLESRTTLPNNNLFRQATFRPKVGIDFTEVVKAYSAFKDVFGKEIPELEQGVVARAIKEEVGLRENDVLGQHTVLVTNALPGADVLQAALNQVRVIRSGNDDNAILTFNSCFGSLKEAIRRATELAEVLTLPRLNDLGRARTATGRLWDFLVTEPDLPAGLSTSADEAKDILRRETFFKDLPRLDALTRAIEFEYTRRFDEAVVARGSAFQDAVRLLSETSGWEDLTPDQQARVSQSLRGPAENTPSPTIPIPQIRAETEACPARLARAIEEMLAILDGQRLVRVRIATWFSGGIETAEQLDEAINAFRDECAALIGKGKKVLVQ